MWEIGEGYPLIGREIPEVPGRRAHCNSDSVLGEDVLNDKPCSCFPLGETEALRDHRASLERCSTAPAPRSPCHPVALTSPRPHIWTISMARLCLPHKHPPAEPSAWAAPDVKGSTPGALLECWGTQSHWTRGETEAHAGHRQRKDMDCAVARLRPGDLELRLYRKDTHTHIHTLQPLPKK